MATSEPYQESVLSDKPDYFYAIEGPKIILSADSTAQLTLATVEKFSKLVLPEVENKGFLVPKALDSRKSRRKRFRIAR